ncbi:5-hydroxytryptamine receptor 4 [Trichoplax sp. H2]|nr:5-hydroxytryptamine receptor 4 [Trichoplax sp. H2]|eukprot:RDD41463.1 5-hydroxytryptamine receptor 4 [Trichoplax sp. H2]
MSFVKKDLFTPCLDVHFFLSHNVTAIVYRELTKFEIMVSIVWSILFVCILLSNLLVLGVICFKRSLWNHSSLLVGSLCLANITYDFMFVLPVKVLNIRNSIHSFVNIYCQLSPTVIQFAFVCCMNFHICSISLEKFIAITSPFWYNQISIYKSAMFVVILLVCWILPTFVAFLPLIIGWWKICPNFCLLSEAKENRYQSLQAWHIFWSFLMFLLPTIVMMVFYVRVYLVARDHARRIHCTSVGIQPAVTLKATKAVAIIVGVYVILQTPYNILQVITVVDYRVIPGETRYLLREWLAYAASWNSVASPIIYGFYNKNLRSNIIALVCRYKSSRFRNVSRTSLLSK